MYTPYEVCRGTSPSRKGKLTISKSKSSRLSSFVQVKEPYGNLKWFLVGLHPATQSVQCIASMSPQKRSRRKERKIKEAHGNAIILITWHHIVTFQHSSNNVTEKISLTQNITLIEQMHGTTDSHKHISTYSQPKHCMPLSFRMNTGIKQ